MHIHSCIYISYTDIYIYIYKYVYAHVYTYMCIPLYICIYTYVFLVNMHIFSNLPMSVPVLQILTSAATHR